MRVVIPQPTGRPPVAHRCLEAEGVAHDLVHVGRGPRAYGRLMRELWQAGEAFCLVEHDVAPWPGALASLEACPGLLCGYDYMRGGNIGHSLGCTRFSAELLALAPDAWRGWGDNAPHLQWDLVDWVNVDAAVFDSLAGYGVYLNDSTDSHLHKHTFHVHEPPVAHSRIEP